MGYFIFFTIVVTSIWAAVDASKLEAYKYQGYNGALGTLIACLLLWIICFPFYLIKRSALVNRTAVLKPYYKEPEKPAPKISHTEELQKLFDLKEKGIITEEEFQKEKSKYLAS